MGRVPCVGQASAQGRSMKAYDTQSEARGSHARLNESTVQFVWASIGILGLCAQYSPRNQQASTLGAVHFAAPTSSQLVKRRLSKSRCRRYRAAALSALSFGMSRSQEGGAPEPRSLSASCVCSWEVGVDARYGVCTGGCREPARCGNLTPGKVSRRHASHPAVALGDIAGPGEAARRPAVADAVACMVSRWGPMTTFWALPTTPAGWVGLHRHTCSPGSGRVPRLETPILCPVHRKVLGQHGVEVCVRHPAHSHPGCGSPGGVGRLAGRLDARHVKHEVLIVDRGGAVAGGGVEVRGSLQFVPDWRPPDRCLQSRGRESWGMGVSGAAGTGQRLRQSLTSPPGRDHVHIYHIFALFTIYMRCASRSATP